MDSADVKLKVIYAGGSWDVFGSAHVEFLKEAKTLYPADQVHVKLVVGIESDEVSFCPVRGTQLE